jgi:hypothetical protein
VPDGGPPWQAITGAAIVPAMLARARIVACVCAMLAASCASLSVDPADEGRGTFRSSAVAFTFLGRDFPQSAILLARANASDSRLANLVVTQERIFPYFWRLDFLLDVVSVRWASVQGTYGPAD